MNTKNLKISKEAKEELRKIATKLIYQQGIKKGKVREMLEVSHTFISNLCKAYKESGMKGIKGGTNKGGRPKDASKNLTNREYKILEEILSDEPRNAKHKQLHLDFGLWTIKLIQEVVKTLFGKELKERKIKEFLNDIGYSNQKPIFRAYQQNPEKVIERVENTLPFIQNEAEKEDREVFYGDEAGFKSTDHRGRTGAKKGKTPIVKATGARFSVNAISCISSRGSLRFMTYQNNFNSDTLIVFLKKLMYKNPNKMTLILDGHPTHKTKKVKDFLKKNNDQVKLYFLPGYSPELNPDEQIRNHTKNNLKGQIIASSLDLVNKVKSSLYKLQKQKDKVKSCFKHPEVKWNTTKNTVN